MEKLSAGKTCCYVAVFLCVTIVGMYSGSLFAEELEQSKTVVVIGTGSIYKGDSARAKDQAISKSLTVAVDLVTQKLIPLESMISNFQTVTNTIYAQTVSFIEGYKVLAESKTGKKYRVIVEATVSLENLKKALSDAGVFLGKDTMPKILFLISEQNPEGELSVYWWGEDVVFVQAACEKAVAILLEARGFPIVQHGGRLQSMGDESMVYGPDLSNEEALHIGTFLKADVVVVGKSTARKTPNTMGEDIRTFVGTVALRAIRTDTYEEIASVDQTAVSVNADEIMGGRDAISRASYMAGEALAAKINLHWHRDITVKEGQIELKISGTGDLSSFVKFRRGIKQIKGVQELLTKEITPNESTLIVDFKGRSNKLADFIMLNMFETFSINIYEISENQLKIELVPEKDKSTGTAVETE